MMYADKVIGYVLHQAVMQFRQTCKGNWKDYNQSRSTLSLQIEYIRGQGIRHENH